MKPSHPDITLDPQFQQDTTDRLLGFEILTRTLRAQYQPIEPDVLADKIGSHKGLSHLIIKNIRKRYEQRRF